MYAPSTERLVRFADHAKHHPYQQINNGKVSGIFNINNNNDNNK
jgi:hypothetical protein